MSLASAATTASLPAAVDEPSSVKVKLLRFRCAGRGARRFGVATATVTSQTYSGASLIVKSATL